MKLKISFSLLTLIAAVSAHANEYAPPATSVPDNSATTAPAASKPAAAQPAAMAPAATGKVARAQFTSAVQNREPVDKVSTLLSDKAQVYFFSEIKDAANQRITHRWEYQNKTVHELGFDVGADRWRVFSSVNVQPEQTGDWKVTVLNQNGATLDSQILKVEAPAPAPAAIPAAPATTPAR